VKQEKYRLENQSGRYYPKTAIEVREEFKSKAYVRWITDCGLLILTIGRPMSKNYSGDCTFPGKKKSSGKPQIGLARVIRR